MSKEETVVSVSMPKELAVKARIEASKLDLSRAAFIRLALEAQLAKLKTEAQKERVPA